MKNSHIEWCDHTFNPWEGCTKVSPGCAHCYAEARNARFGGGTAPNWGKGAPRRRTSAANWKQVEKWNREAGEQLAAFNREVQVSFGHLDEIMEEPHRPRVFCASLADWLDDEVPIEWLADFLDLVRRCQNLDFLLLTKRPQNWRARIESIKTESLELAAWLLGWLLHGGEFTRGKFDGLRPEGPANVWIGTTVEDQTRADERIPELLKIPARVRFLSCEPLLGPVNIPAGVYSGGRLAMDEGWGIHWVIAGGESGPKARPMHPDWARSLRDQCKAAGVAFHFKQWGEWQVFPDKLMIVRVGKKAAGRLLDGVEHNEFPEVRS